MLSSLFNFKGEKNSNEYERIPSQGIGSAYHFSNHQTIVSPQAGDFIQLLLRKPQPKTEANR